MEHWLLPTANICTYLSGSKYPTFSIASLAFNGLLTHCNKYLGVEVESIESSSRKATLEVQEKANEKCLQYLITYQEWLKFIPSQIVSLVSILHQIIKSVGEGIVATDSAGMHRPIWIRKNARKKISEVAQPY